LSKLVTSLQAVANGSVGASALSSITSAASQLVSSCQG
jgi:hypothetical protein